MLLLLLTGFNMRIFELTAGRVIDRWDKSPSAPPASNAVAAVSLVMWISIICMGRIIGFTTSRKKVVVQPPRASISTTFSRRPAERRPNLNHGFTEK